MKIAFGTQSDSYALGLYLTNWGAPIKQQWELGIYLVKWYIGIQFFKEDV